ncbi:MAG: hypothetical protein OXH64_03730 [Rhodospirillaceae bacterium]|nr:hypothetical protein [Rhodospirillaceae bacterium]
MSTISELLERASLKRTGTVRGSESVPSNSSGVYIVSLSERCEQNDRLFDTAPIDSAAVEQWLCRIPKMKLDGQEGPSPSDIAKRLGDFWLPDESILYIGKTGRLLKRRIGEYYRTPLGARKPHRGGHWIKTLSVLDETFVHYIETPNAGDTEERLLEAFVSQVSHKSKQHLKDPDRPFPYASLEYPKGNRKRHGLARQAL